MWLWLRLWLRLWMPTAGLLAPFARHRHACHHSAGEPTRGRAAAAPPPHCQGVAGAAPPTAPAAPGATAISSAQRAFRHAGDKNVCRFFAAPRAGFRTSAVMAKFAKGRNRLVMQHFYPKEVNEPDSALGEPPARLFPVRWKRPPFQESPANSRQQRAASWSCTVGLLTSRSS